MQAQPTAPRRRKSLPPHWYRIHIDECVYCGRTRTERERIYGKPPTNPAKRYDYQQSFCGGHTL